MAVEIAIILALVGFMFVLSLIPKFFDIEATKFSGDFIKRLLLGIVIILVVVITSMTYQFSVENANTSIQATTLIAYRVMLWLMYLFFGYNLLFFGATLYQRWETF